MTAVLERIATKVRASLEEVEATKRVEAKRQEEEHKTEVRRRMRGAYRPQISAEVWQALRMRMRLTRPKAKLTYAYEGWQGQVIFTLPDETGYQTEWAVNFDLCDRETGRISSVSVPEISSNAEDHRMWLPRRIRRDRNSQINSPFPGCTWGETIAALAYQFQQDIAKNKEVIAREDEEQRQEQQRQRAENERQRQLRQAKEAVEEAALAERLALVNKVDVSVREQIGNAVSNLQFWPAGPVTLYRWSYCVGGFFDEGE